MIQLIEQGAVGQVSVAIGGQTVFTLTTANNATDQARYLSQSYTGALTGPCTVTMPNVNKIGWAQNLTSGGFNVVLTAGAGTTATIPANGQWYFYWCDSNSNVSLVSVGLGSANIAGNLSVVGTQTVSGASTLNNVVTITGPDNLAATPALTVRGLNGSTGLRITDNALMVAPGTLSNTTGNAANLFMDAVGIIYFSVSSLRYKHSVEPYPTPLVAAGRLRAIRFKSNNDADGHRWFAGFGAEEVHDAGLSEFVNYDKEGRPDGVQYGPLAALAIGAVNDLVTMLERLAKRVEALEGA